MEVTDERGEQIVQKLQSGLFLVSQVIMRLKISYMIKGLITTVNINFQS